MIYVVLIFHTLDMKQMHNMLRSNVYVTEERN